jgi:hypothetical protein
LEKRAEQVLPGSGGGGEREGVGGRGRNGPKMYSHMNKCKRKK